MKVLRIICFELLKLAIFGVVISVFLLIIAQMVTPDRLAISKKTLIIILAISGILSLTLGLLINYLDKKTLLTKGGLGTGRNHVQIYLKEKFGVKATDEQVEELVKFVLASKGVGYVNFSKAKPKSLRLPPVNEYYISLKHIKNKEIASLLIDPRFYIDEQILHACFKEFFLGKDDDSGSKTFYFELVKVNSNSHEIIANTLTFVSGMYVINVIANLTKARESRNEKYIFRNFPEFYTSVSSFLDANKS